MTKSGSVRIFISTNFRKVYSPSSKAINTYLSKTLHVKVHLLHAQVLNNKGAVLEGRLDFDFGVNSLFHNWIFVVSDVFYCHAFLPFDLLCKVNYTGCSLSDYSCYLVGDFLYCNHHLLFIFHGKYVEICV